MPSFPLDDKVKEYILRDDNLLTFSKAFLETRGKALLKAHWEQTLPDEVEKKEIQDMEARVSVNDKHSPEERRAIWFVESLNLDIVKKLLKASQTINWQLQDYDAKQKAPGRAINAMAYILELYEEDAVRFVELLTGAYHQTGIGDFVANPAEGFDQNLQEATRNQANSVTGENWDENLKAEYFANFMFPKLQTLSHDRKLLSEMNEEEYDSFVKRLINQHDMFVTDMYYIQGVDKIWNPIHKTLFFLIIRVGRFLREGLDDEQLRKEIWQVIIQTANGAYGKSRNDQTLLFKKIMNCIKAQKMNVEDVVYKYATDVLSLLVQIQMDSKSFKDVKDVFTTHDGEFWSSVNNQYYSMDYRVSDDAEELKPISASIRNFTLQVLIAMGGGKDFMEQGRLFWQGNSHLNTRLTNILLLTVANAVSEIPVVGNPSFNSMCRLQFARVLSAIAKDPMGIDWLKAWSPDKIKAISKMLATKFANDLTITQLMPYTKMAIEGILRINEDVFTNLWNTVGGSAGEQSDKFWEEDSSFQLAMIKDILRGGIGLQDDDVSIISKNIHLMVQEHWNISNTRWYEGYGGELIYSLPEKKES